MIVMDDLIVAIDCNRLVEYKGEPLVKKQLCVLAQSIDLPPKISPVLMLDWKLITRFTISPIQISTYPPAHTHYVPLPYPQISFMIKDNFTTFPPLNTILGIPIIN